ncbi:MAG: GyrI-like domain-containing protein [Bacillota bacterium]
MAAFDFKKERKDLYQPATAPAIVDVPEMLFITAGGRGDPNTSDAFKEAIQLLYGLAYALRMNKTETGYFEYVVPPAEGFWDFADPRAYLESGTIPQKDEFVWTLVIRQPAFVTADMFETARAKLKKKKPELDTGPAKLERIAEGLCVQAMHIGPYATEPATVKAMERYQEQRGFALDFTQTRRHHEIYLSNPQTTAPEKMKTILRIPIKKR